MMLLGDSRIRFPRGQRMTLVGGSLSDVIRRVHGEASSGSLDTLAMGFNSDDTCSDVANNAFYGFLADALSVGF